MRQRSAHNPPEESAAPNYLPALLLFLVDFIFLLVVVGSVRGEITDWYATSPTGSAPNYVDAGHAFVMTDDGGRAEVLTDVRAPVTLGVQRYMSVAKFDSNGVEQWVTDIWTYDGLAVRIKQGSVTDRDIYVLWNHDGFGPGISRLDIATGAQVWQTTPWVTSYAYQGGSGFDIGGAWMDFEFHGGTGADRIVLFGVEGDFAANSAGVYYSPAITVIKRVNGGIISRHTYGPINPNAFPGAQSLMALWPTRSVRHTPSGGYLVYTNAIEAIAQAPGYRILGFFEMYVNPNTLTWDLPTSTYLHRFGSGTQFFNTVALDARALSPTEYVVTGYLDPGPNGGKDVFLVHRQVPTFGASQTPELGGFHDGWVYGTTDDEVASGIAIDSNQGALLALSHGATVPTELFAQAGGLGVPALLKLDSAHNIEWARDYTPYREGVIRAVESLGVKFRVLGDATQTSGERVGVSALVLPTSPGDPLCGLVDVPFTEQVFPVDHRKFSEPNRIPLPAVQFPWGIPHVPANVRRGDYCRSCNIQADFDYFPGTPQDFFQDQCVGNIGSYDWSISYSGGTSTNPTPTIGGWLQTPLGNPFLSATLTVTDAVEPYCTDTYTFP